MWQSLSVDIKRVYHIPVLLKMSRGGKNYYSLRYI